ncbi:MAG: hypothetical protein R3Y24_01985 [Eubacteriales bacterium]
MQSVYYDIRFNAIHYFLSQDTIMQQPVSNTPFSQSNVDYFLSEVRQIPDDSIMEIANVTEEVLTEVKKSMGLL